MMRADNIEIGTSGWRFDDWAGVFYPLRVPKNRWLEYYSARFRVGELNSSYYRLPSRATIAAIQNRTPAAFRLFIKLHADVTHHRVNPDRSIADLNHIVRPLQESGKLLGFLAQFPASFKKSGTHEKYLSELSQSVAGQRLCIEFRDRSWDNEETREWFREHKLTWVCPDEPELPGLIEPALRSTSDIVYIRLHGRNEGTWYNPEAGDRYDYAYSEAQMKEWGSRLLNYHEEISGGYLFFNNCHLGQAVKNATWLFQWILDRREHIESNESNDNFTLSQP